MKRANDVVDHARVREIGRPVFVAMSCGVLKKLSGKRFAVSRLIGRFAFIVRSLGAKPIHLSETLEHSLFDWPSYECNVPTV